MKIAFSTKDRKTLAKRTGQAKEFVVFEISDTEIIETKYFENTHEHHDHDEEHGHEHSHKEITDNLLDVDYLYVKNLGKNFKKDLEKEKINYKKIKEDNIETVISQLFDK